MLARYVIEMENELAVGRCSAEQAFELQKGERAPDGIRRIARVQVEAAARRLRDEAADPGEAVHGARKGFKRVRSTLRLARGALDSKTRRRENTAIREAGRRLSAARDSQVMLETLDALIASGPRQAGNWAAFRGVLDAQQGHAQLELQADPAALADVAGELHEVELRIGRWRFDGAAKQAELAPGLAAIYRRGRREMRRARRQPTAESLHSWRKRTKDLWYGAQILRPLAPRRLKRVARRAHKLSDLLGTDHDHAVLREHALANPGAFAAPGSLDQLLCAIDARSAGLRAQAFGLGGKLYRRKARRWQRRLTR